MSLAVLFAPSKDMITTGVLGFFGTPGVLALYVILLKQVASIYQQRITEALLPAHEKQFQSLRGQQIEPPSLWHHQQLLLCVVPTIERAFLMLE